MVLRVCRQPRLQVDSQRLQSAPLFQAALPAPSPRAWKGADFFPRNLTNVISYVRLSQVDVQLLKMQWASLPARRRRKVISIIDSPREQNRRESTSQAGKLIRVGFNPPPEAPGEAFLRGIPEGSGIRRLCGLDLLHSVEMKGPGPLERTGSIRRKRNYLLSSKFGPFVIQIFSAGWPEHRSEPSPLNKLVFWGV